MKRVVLGLIAAAAVFVAMTPAESQAQYYRPGYRVNIYGGYRPYPYPYYRPYYGPAYYPPPLLLSPAGLRTTGDRPR